MDKKTRVGIENKNTPKAINKPRIRDLEWAAGFIEADGWFISSGSKTAQVGADQLNKEPLLKLQKYFGGSLREYLHDCIGKPKKVWRWLVTGNRARGVSLTLFSLMSLKRKEQIKKMFVSK